MTPRISLITAVFAAALAVSVPAAFGDSWGDDRQSQTTFVGSPDLVDRAVAAEERRVAAMLDARERAHSAGSDELSTPMLDARENAFGAKLQVQLSNGISPDAFERAVQARGSTVDRVVANDNRSRVVPTNDPVPVEVTGSGREIEWPQIGIGLGIGIALMLGLVFALRATRHRELAH